MKGNKTVEYEPELKEEHNSGKPAGFLAGLVVGGLAGAGAMLMFAPRSGKDTREEIQNKGTELRDQVTDKVDDVIEQGRAKGNEIKLGIRREANNLHQQGLDVLDTQMDRVADAMDDGKTAIHNY